MQQEYINDLLKYINNLRKKYIIKQFLIIVLAAILSYIFYQVLMNNFEFIKYINGLLWLAILIILGIIIYKLLSTFFSIPTQFKRIVGISIANLLLEKHDAKIYYDGTLIIPLEICELFVNNDYDDFYVDYVIEAKNFIIQYMEFTREDEYEDSDGNIQTDIKVIFKGYIVLFVLNKNYNVFLYITEKKFHLSDILPLSYDTTRIKLDNPLFEEKFDVYANDQINARAYLDHKRMEELLSIKLKSNLIIYDDTAYYAFKARPFYLNSIPFYLKIKIDDLNSILDIYKSILELHKKIK